MGLAGIGRKALRRLPVGVKKRVQSAVHPARQIAFRRALSTRSQDLGLLSVIIPIHNVQDYVAECLNSVISQTYTNLEIILVDDGSSDDSLQIAKEYASRDKRITVLELDHGGNGRARNRGIAIAKGTFLTFADSDDIVAPGAYATMMTGVTESQSDFVVGSSDRFIGSKRFPTKLSSRLHAIKRTGITLSEFPEILDDVFLWNKVFRRPFWDEFVGPIPEGVLYEDQETTARAYVRAESFEVLDDHVYSWRQRPGGKSITQGKAELENLQDRLLVAGKVSHLLLNESSDDAVQVWCKRLFGSDLLPYFDLVGNRSTAYWDTLRSGTIKLLALFNHGNSIRADTWTSMDPHSRVFLHLANAGTKDDVESVIAARIDCGTGYKLQADGELYVATPSYASDPDVALEFPRLLCSPGALQFESAVRLRDLEDGRGLLIRGHAFIRGLSTIPDLHYIRCVFTLFDGIEVPQEVSNVVDPRIDIDANDSFASHSSSGFEIILDQSPYLKTAVSVQINLTIDDHTWSENHRFPISEALKRLSEPEHPDSPSVVGFAVDKNSETFTVDVEWGTLDSAEKIYLSTSQNRIDPANRAQCENSSWRYTFELHHKFWGRDVYAYPPGAYTLRHMDVRAGKIRSIKAGPALALQAPLDRSMVHANLTAWVADGGNFAVNIAPPLNMTERSSFGQRQLQLGFQHPSEAVVQDHIVLESFNGKVCTDSPAAIGRAWAERDPDKVFYFSIADYSVAYPSYARPLLRGSQTWVEVVRSASQLINNNNYPFYFRKSANQHYLQTWHGTPLKKVGLDAPRQYLSTSYRRLMEREGKMWDLLISQNSHSTAVLPRAFGFLGPVFQTNYPRNDVLVHETNSRNRERLRESLGISNEKHVILYAPTWRDHAPIVAGKRSFTGYLDGGSMLHRLGPDYILLNRGHHNAPGSLIEEQDVDLIEVSTYPEINDLLLVADALVTDYSSVMFDFALMQKPIYLLAPDLALYEQGTRGLCLDYLSTVPGPVFSNQDELFDHISATGLYFDVSRRQEFLSKYLIEYFEDSAGMCVDALLRPRSPNDNL